MLIGFHPGVEHESLRLKRLHEYNKDVTTVHVKREVHMLTQPTQLTAKGAREFTIMNNKGP